MTQIDSLPSGFLTSASWDSNRVSAAPALPSWKTARTDMPGAIRRSLLSRSILTGKVLAVSLLSGTFMVTPAWNSRSG